MSVILGILLVSAGGAFGFMFGCTINTKFYFAHKTEVTRMQLQHEKDKLELEVQSLKYLTKVGAE